jgi:hypothetical protein
MRGSVFPGWRRRGIEVHKTAVRRTHERIRGGRLGDAKVVRHRIVTLERKLKSGGVSQATFNSGVLPLLRRQMRVLLNRHHGRDVVIQAPRTVQKKMMRSAAEAKASANEAKASAKKR